MSTNGAVAGLAPGRRQWTALPVGCRDSIPRAIAASQVVATCLWVAEADLALDDSSGAPTSQQAALRVRADHRVHAADLRRQSTSYLRTGVVRSSKYPRTLYVIYHVAYLPPDTYALLRIV